MIPSLRARSLLGLIALFAAAAPLRAQGARFNVAGGLSLANSDFGLRNDAGYSLTVGATWRQRATPLAFRLEGFYNAFDQKAATGTATAGGVTGNTVYEFSGSGSSMTPYMIGGIGLYGTREPNRLFDVETQTNVGWNLGGGLRFPLTGFSAYVEARYHSVSNVRVSFTPIVFGLTF